MNNNSRSHILEEILAGYVLGNLDEAELVWLNEQLASNPELKEQISQLETSLLLMPYSLSDEHIQTDLRSQILAKAQNKSRSKFSYWGLILGAVSTMGALWLGFENFNLRQQIAIKAAQLQQQQELTALMNQPNNLLVSFQGLDQTVTASGNLFISPTTNKALLTLQNLQPLSGKQVYRLWAVSQKQKTGCVNFIPDSEGAVYLEISSGEALIDASSILITIEPEADTEQPLGSNFLAGFYTNI